MDNRKDRIHLKLYLTMIFCVVFAIFLTSTILYVNFQSILMKHEYKARLQNMETEKARITKLSNHALSTAYQIMNDVSIMKLFVYDNISSFDESAAFLQMRYYLTSVPDIDSIYVYNKNNNRIYNVTNESELMKEWNPDYDKKDDNFYDSSAVEILNNSDKYLPFIPIPRFYPLNEDSFKCVYSYIIYKTSVKNKERDAVLLNLNKEYLFQGFDNQSDNIKLVIDQNNKVVYSNSDHFMVTEQLQNSFDQEGIMDERDSGYYLTDIDGVKSVVMFTSKDKHNWRYISIVSYGMLLAQVNRMQAISILITAMIAAAGMLTAHLFSRRLSIPIKSMSKDVKKLQRENLKLHKAVKNRKTAELLENGGWDSKGNKMTGQEFLSLIEMECSTVKKIVILCMCPDNYQILLETQGVEALKSYLFAAANILSELLGESTKVFQLDMWNDKNLLFLQWEDNLSAENLREHIRKMQACVSDYYDISISVLVSSPEADSDRLYSLFEQVKETLARSIFFGPEYVVFAAEMEVKSVSHYEYPEQKEKQLLENLMSGKAAEAKKNYEEIITETYQYPIIIYNMVISRLVFAIDKVISTLKKNGNASSFSGYFVLSNLIQETDNITVRNNKFYDLFQHIQSELEKRKSDKQELLVVKINDMIEKEYTEASFSLDYLADSIGISTAYMCRLYKLYTGTTITDRLSFLRMKKARELLLETQLSVNEVAERVGYSNATYFYRVFKKENGVTPKEFRRK
ncbi:helix-turn-helix domain-containing protein [Clostridium sp. KNHs205]|uniref:AraC family transcriptional regulator n=1 Tax=Clostridium sp. KNHs205 TaxID=1449050 RepID=UPI00051BA0BB|nr:helix-turn-helix domain-containing protein [Clostridium sp. KNHs205]